MTKEDIPRTYLEEVAECATWRGRTLYVYRDTNDVIVSSIRAPYVGGYVAVHDNGTVRSFADLSS